jgi:hypothetical protein
MTRDGFDPAVLRAAYDAVAPEYAQTFGTLFYVLHHLPREDLPLALAELGRVLVPGGGLLLATHEGSGEFFADGHPGITGTLYSGAELDRALTGAGFGSVQVRTRDPLPHERQSGRVYVIAAAHVP